MPETKTSFIAIIGIPNVGKSTILNKLLGAKIAIVSEKPQTTRTRIMGVLTEGDAQLVFTDTPGYHKPRNKLGEKMIDSIGESISGVDVAMFVVEPKGEIRKEELELMKRLENEKIPAILVINKIDTVPEKEELIPRIAEFNKRYNFIATVPISARRNDGIDVLKAELMKTAVPSPFFFPEDTLTDQPERVIASEFIREKILRNLDREVPHGIAVGIELFRERDDGSGILDIEATIYCEKDSHKGIIIGKAGQMLKIISSRARADMEKFFDCHINLQCWVKVKKDWRNKEGLIHNFGLD
ncbi:MAG TPA: GTPase Era [Clostridiales bacterium]|nr:GTPase Era [Clostridiales bacterium]